MSRTRYHHPQPVAQLQTHFRSSTASAVSESLTTPAYMQMTTQTPPLTPLFPPPLKRDDIAPVFPRGMASVHYHPVKSVVTTSYQTLSPVVNNGAAPKMVNNNAAGKEASSSLLPNETPGLWIRSHVIYPFGY